MDKKNGEECKRKLLFEEQVDMLQFMINNYYKKNRDIYSYDEESVFSV